jgi:hypothetical protein
MTKRKKKGRRAYDQKPRRQLPNPVFQRYHHQAGFSAEIFAMASSSLPNATALLQRAERAGRVPDSAWTEHRETIKKLYIDSGMKLEVLVTHMGENHGFTAR